MTRKFIVIILTIFIFSGFYSCDVSTKPYLQHELKFTKLYDHCAARSDKFEMNSNTNGERYVFQQCLDPDFDKSKLGVERKGDTVVVQFNRSNPAQALYEIILDIDSYPRYSFLTIGDNTFTIIPAGN